MIPLVSDTESKPTAAMREAIAKAQVGDEQKGEDPTVNELLALVAEMLGKPAALWLPGGTMCNMIAIKVHTQPGDVVFAEAMAHILRAESGGAALTSGIMLEAIPSKRGIFSADQLSQAIARVQATPEPYAAPLGMVCVEQTHNFGGGSVWTEDELAAIRELAHQKGMPVHMDGARLLNAAIASDRPASVFGAQVDSVWIDFTKGLGAPIGAVLAGSVDFIARARRYKQAFGGAMRQAGIAAAGCLHALDHHVQRLDDDHKNAAALASGLVSLEGVTVRNPQPESNMVFFSLAPGSLSHQEFIGKMAEHGVALGDAGDAIRAVTHIDVHDQHIGKTLSIMAEVLATRDTP